MTSLRFILTMAWRESRAAGRRLALLMAAVAVGVGALVAINSFTANLRDSARTQAQAILGADLVATSRGPFTDRAAALLDTVACGGPPCGEVLQVTSFAAMTYVPRTEWARLVQAAAVEPGYPLYGRIVTDPDSGWAALQQGPHVVVDPALLTALDAQVGDSLVLGNQTFAIVGMATDIPGDVGVRAALGPRVFIPYRWLEATGLITTGSLATYQRFARLAPEVDQQATEARLENALAADRVTVRTVVDDREDLDEALQQMGRFLGLVALVALLLGGLGVASAIHVFIQRKLDTLAVLRCLGATGNQMVAAYLLQALAVGLAGSVAGAAGGVGLQHLLPSVFSGLLPVDARVALSWPAIAMGLGTGLWVTGVFAFLPLLAVRRISPLVVLRRDFVEPARRGRRMRRWPVMLLLAGSIFGLASLQVGNAGAGLGFTAGIAVVLGVLALASSALVRGMRRWFPARLPYVWRQGLANLYRPGNQTTMVVLALGFGAFLLCTLYLVQSNLLARFRLDGTGARPNLVFWDIQPDQLDPVTGMIREAGFTAADPVPIVPMRIAAVKGVPVEDLLRDSALVDDQGQPLGRWAFRREYRSTYRDTVVGTETLAVGDWWPPADRRAAGPPYPISMEVEVAGELGVTVGDTIVWDVQGIRVPTRVGSLRTVNWARLEPNFFVVFPPGVLEEAPQTWVTLARVGDGAARGRLQRSVAERFSNVTTLDLTQLIQSIERIVDRAILVVRFMALFSLAAGAVVLVGAVASSRLQRLREGVLLKTLGATRPQVLRVAFAEYASLGVLAVLVAVILSTAAGWVLMRFVFELPFTVPGPALAGVAAAVLALTLAVGFLTGRETFRRTPLELLRAE